VGITLRHTRAALVLVAVAACAFVPGAVAAPEAPANDNFADAKAIAGERGSVAGHNFGATKEPLEPNHAGNAGGASVWYRWTAPAPGQYVFNTPDSDFDTVLAVYTGALSELSAVASSDDGAWGSEVSFRAAAGTVYQVAVDGFGGKTGRYGLAWRQAPFNDNFAEAAELRGTSGIVTGSSQGATPEPGEPDEAQATVWYRWTAPASGLVSLDTAGSNFDTILNVYRGTSVPDLVRVARNDDDPFLGCCSSRVSFRASEGQTYRISIDDFDGSGGLFTLSWRPLVRGTAGGDVLVGTAGSEEIRGLGGDDLIRARGGNDVVFAGAGTDLVFGGRGNDLLVGGYGADEIIDLSGEDALYGGRGRDHLNGRDSRPDDVVNGGVARDRCLADSGDRRIACP
jgi:Ca2+-binding RTX toxin-like protein